MPWFIYCIFVWRHFKMRQCYAFKKRDLHVTSILYLAPLWKSHIVSLAPKFKWTEGEMDLKILPFMGSCVTLYNVCNTHQRYMDTAFRVIFFFSFQDVTTYVITFGIFILFSFSYSQIHPHRHIHTHLRWETLMHTSRCCCLYILYIAWS